MSRRGRAEECDRSGLRPCEQNSTRRTGPGQPARADDGGPQEIEDLASIFLEIEREISLGRGGTWLPSPRVFRGRRRFKIQAALARREPRGIFICRILDFNWRPRDNNPFIFQRASDTLRIREMPAAGIRLGRKTGTGHRRGRSRLPSHRIPRIKMAVRGLFELEIEVAIRKRIFKVIFEALE